MWEPSINAKRVRIIDLSSGGGTAALKKLCSHNANPTTRRWVDFHLASTAFLAVAGGRRFCMGSPFRRNRRAPLFHRSCIHKQRGLSFSERLMGEPHSLTSAEYQSRNGLSGVVHLQGQREGLEMSKRPQAENSKGADRSTDRRQFPPGLGGILPLSLPLAGIRT